MLEPRARAGLARAMVCDVMNALAAAQCPERIIIYTASDEVARIARAHNFDIVEEVSVRGHSAAVNKMVEELSSQTSQLLSIAGDLPLLTPADVDSIFNRVSTDIGLVSSRDGTGTNAALFVLPARIRMEYGDGRDRESGGEGKRVDIRGRRII